MFRLVAMDKRKKRNAAREISVMILLLLLLWHTIYISISYPALTGAIKDKEKTYTHTIIG